MTRLFQIICGLCVILSVRTSLATLGEPLASVQSDAGQLRAAQKPGATVTGQFGVSEMTADGNTIKQYSNAEGIVFAVSWVGISKPDLAVLFGAYFKEYIDAVNAVPRKIGAKSSSLRTTKMVVRRGGRMRDQRGLAYIPSLVPSNVNVEELP